MNDLESLQIAINLIRELNWLVTIKHQFSDRKNSSVKLYEQERQRNENTDVVLVLQTILMGIPMFYNYMN